MASASATKPCVRGTASLSRAARRTAAVRCQAAASVSVGKAGSYTVKGTVRKQNEDRLVIQSLSGPGPSALHGVFDGHGGDAVSQWLSENLSAYIVKEWRASNVGNGLGNAFRSADEFLLEPQGFLGMGSRGLGGPKCGSTAVVSVIYEEGGKRKVTCANCGDARAVLVRGGKAVLMSEDHVPDSEKERRRIESKNPNMKRPLVQFVGSTWRVGGLLALSRAFGDAYLKPTGEFEGISTANADYSSGFGLIVDPFIATQELTAEDSYLVLSSDGLYANEERGGGGGLQLEDVASMVTAAGAGADPAALAKQLTEEAVKRGTTDDVTVVVVPLK